MSSPETLERPAVGGRAPLEACAVCEAMRGTDARYVARVLCDPRRREANARAIADSLGFCSDHVACLATFEDRSAQIGAVLREAVRTAGALLEAGAQFHDRLLEILFAAADACPACRYAERSLARVLVRDARTPGPGVGDRSGGAPCVPHFLALVGVLELPELLPRVQAQIELLMKAAQAVRTGGEAAQFAATCIVAGAPDGPARAAPRRDADSAGEDRCPVCSAMRRASARWIEAAKESARMDVAPWAVLPLCRGHLWACHRCGDRRLAARATSHALEVFLGSLRRAALTLAQEDERLEREARSVWYRPKSPAYLLGARRKVVAAMLRCPACDRVAVARERAVGELLDTLRATHRRDAPGRAGALCLKHFALVFTLAPAGAVRETLRAMQAARLRALEAELERFAHAAGNAPRAAAPDRAAWKDAICRFSGSV